MKVGDRVIELKYHSYKGVAGNIIDKPISGKIGTITKVHKHEDGSSFYLVEFENGRKYHTSKVIPVTTS